MAPATDDRRRYGKAARDDDFNAARFVNYDLTLRILYADYTSVYWYRGGREACEVAGNIEDDMRPKDL